MVRFDKRSAEQGARYVEDRRGQRRRGAPAGGSLPIGKMGGGLGGVLVLVLALMFGPGVLGDGSGSGFDITAPGFDQGGSQVGAEGATGQDVPDPDADTVEFMQFLMFDVQETWNRYFESLPAGSSRYEFTTLVIFEDSVSTGCGNATSAVGPFYCPAPNDRKVYIDLGFWHELDRRFGAPGDFAQAYVVAHEIGHHLQTVLGISDQVRRLQAENPSAKNELSVRQELQADCFAGVWAHSAAGRTTSAGLPLLEPGDIDEGLAAAAAVGDDRIQAQAGMTVDPHTWSHGSAAARQKWFRVGFDTGDPVQCDTFAVDRSEVGL